MSRRWVVIAAASGLFVGASAATWLALRREPKISGRLRELRASHDGLRRQLETHLAAEPLLQQPELQAGDVVVGLRTPYVARVIREVSRRYLDRVQLDLAPNIHVQETGEVKKDTFIGAIGLGAWTLDVDLRQLTGTLSADTPDLVAQDNRVRVSMPVRVLAAKGEGVLRFAWNSKHVANVVCRDFEVQEHLEATALPDRYRVRGSFAFFHQGDTIVARPEFPAEKFRVRIDLLPESWQKVEAALRAQDTFGRCAMGIDPPALLTRLRELAANGFEFKLPRSLFRPVVMPAQFRSRVDVQGTQVDVAVEPKALRLSADHLWYAAALRVRILNLAPTGLPRPRPKT